MLIPPITFVVQFAEALKGGDFSHWVKIVVRCAFFPMKTLQDTTPLPGISGWRAAEPLATLRDLTRFGTVTYGLPVNSMSQADGSIDKANPQGTVRYGFA